MQKRTDQRWQQRDPKQRSAGQQRPRDRRQPANAGSDDAVMLYGHHAVEAALANPARHIDAVLATANALPRFEAALLARAVTARTVEGHELDRLLPRDAVHQGVVLKTRLLSEPDLADFDAAGQPERRQALILVLDQITDPHNVGAILRSAAAFGVTALVMTARHSPPLDGALAKAASGGLEIVPVVTVTNLARALESLADLGYFRIGLDGSGTSPLEDADMTSPLAIVLGAESSGMRRLTTEHCDDICRITTTGTIASLNVSNAAAIALHAVRSRQRSL